MSDVGADCRLAVARVRRHLLVPLVWLLAAGTCCTAWGQAPAKSAPWPSRTVRIVVGFPGGSTPDLAARTLAEPLSRALGQPVIIENRVGASGNIAADVVAKATDDHTLGVVINGNLTSARQLYARLPYNPATDFSLISLLTTAPLVLIAPAGLPGGSAFLAAARQAGSQWNFGSPGNGSVAHLGMELIKSRVPGVEPVHIPYAGNPQVITAMLGGQVQMALVPPGIALPHLRAGTLRGIGLAGGRSALAPEIAPLADIGIQGLDLEVWTALVAPAGLAPAARARLTELVPRLLREADIRQKLFAQGWQAVGSSPEGLITRLQSETQLLGNIIRLRGIKIE